jgi:hypothetical protein
LYGRAEHTGSIYSNNRNLEQKLALKVSKNITSPTDKQKNPGPEKGGKDSEKKKGDTHLQIDVRRTELGEQVAAKLEPRLVHRRVPDNPDAIQHAPHVAQEWIVLPGQTAFAGMQSFGLEWATLRVRY